MKKLLLSLLFVCALALTLAITLVSCGDVEQPTEKQTEKQPTGERPTNGQIEQPTGEQPHQHVEEIVPAKSPTCTETGLTDGKKCSVCDAVLMAQEEVPAKGHTEVIDEAKAPTCTETGLTEGKHCSVCDLVLVEQDTKEAKGHNYKNYVCTVCGDEIKVSQGLAIVPNGDGTCYIYGIGRCKDNDIVIPWISPSGDSVTSICDGAFSDCSSFTSVVIPDSVTYIGNSAFSGCSSLESVVIPDGVTNIGSYAFYNCNSITSVVISDGVTNIGSYAFKDCSSLTSVVIPDSVTSIGNSAFSGCISLTSITVSDNNTKYKSIDGNLYSKDGTTLIQYAVGKTDTSFVIPDSVTSIGYNVFYNCSSLTSIVIHDRVTSINSGAFSNCTSLTYNEYDNAYYLGNDINPYVVLIKAKNKEITSCNIHTNTKIIYNGAFAYCSSLTSVAIGDSVTIIGKHAFLDCSSLKSVVIPEGVTSIGYYAFCGCNSLERLVIPNSVTSIDDWVLPDCVNLRYNKYDNAYYLGNDTNPYVVLVVSNDKETTIHTDTKFIYSSAFSGCKRINSVVIPDGVTSIGACAFKNCISLTSVVIPDSVTSIGGEAFNNCINLTSIVIPDGVTSISDWTFAYCRSLKSIEIPHSVTNISYLAFYNCVRLTSITYNGTKTEWEEISKGSDWNDKTGRYVIHCTDGDIQK